MIAMTTSSSISVKPRGSRDSGVGFIVEGLSLVLKFDNLKSEIARRRADSLGTSARPRSSQDWSDPKSSTGRNRGTLILSNITGTGFSPVSLRERQGVSLGR